MRWGGIIKRNGRCLWPQVSPHGRGVATGLATWHGPAARNASISDIEDGIAPSAPTMRRAYMRRAYMCRSELTTNASSTAPSQTCALNTDCSGFTISNWAYLYSIPSTHGGGGYVTGPTCTACHPNVYVSWIASLNLVLRGALTWGVHCRQGVPRGLAAGLLGLLGGYLGYQAGLWVMCTYESDSGAVIHVMRGLGSGLTHEGLRHRGVMHEGVNHGGVKHGGLKHRGFNHGRHDG